MMHLILLLTTVALFGNTCQSASVNQINLLTDMDNSIDSNAVTKDKNHNFLTISERPKITYAHAPGTILTIKCGALASPAPSIRWYKNDEPIYEYELESYELIDSNPTSAARLTSSIVVPHTIGQDTYSCLVTSGAKISRATTLVYSTDNDSTELSERTKLSPLEPHIAVSYTMYVDIIGNDIVLPCHAKGHPRPHITWRHNDGPIITNNSRMNVLHNGDLAISGLRWKDMGEYICTAKNVFGVTSAKTFVYPAKPESS